MEKTLDDFVTKLQEEIFEKTKETYGEAVFSRWQNPRFMGKMTDPSCVGRVTGTCGDTMEIYLKLEKDRVREASFFTAGCGASVACGSIVAELVTGKDLDDAAQIGGDTVLETLGALPEEERHCAYLAAEALQAAIHQWMLKKIKA
ncbi:MAG: iron-sulfur cluster assembly scaffold protein [Deltaproteobacteria bacterium]|jgi:nitrogen fixation NifU-like protein